MSQDIEAVLNEVFSERGFSPRGLKRTAHSHPKAKNLIRDGKEWREQVAHRLLEGYGVYDIAIWLDCHVSYIQREVIRLRKEGWLEKWWGHSE